MKIFTCIYKEEAPRILMEKEIGEVSSFFSHINVATIKLSENLKIGNKIHIKGHTTDLKQDVESIQIERKSVNEAKKGDHIGIKVINKIRPGDKVFLVNKN